MTRRIRLLLLLCLTPACTSTRLSIRKSVVPQKKSPEKPKLIAKRNKKAAAKKDTGGKATIPLSVFNLINNVAGAGILTLSAGMAGGTGWIPAIAICTILGAISAHTFQLIGAACELTGEEDFKGLWSLTIGSDTTYMVDSIVAIMCLAACVIYCGILGDVFTPLLASAGVPPKFNSRTSNIILLSAGLLLPMSLIKNLSALAFTSILGLAAIMYTVVFIVIRAFDGTYAEGGKFLVDDVIVKPSFVKESIWNLDFTSLVLASNLGLAYIAHYNAPAYYRELQDSNLQRFGKMVGIAFMILTLLYIITMAAGYETFGDVTYGNILLNYHPQDLLSTLGRLATGLSILFGFPLVAKGARESIASAAASCGYPQIASAKNHKLLVIVMLAIVTYISCTVPDVSLVVGLTGAIMGSFIVYACPAVIYTRAVGLTKGTDSPDYKRARLNLALVPFGIVIASLGVYVTLTGGS